MLDLVNGARKEAGKSAVIWGDPDLEAYALQRAKELQIFYSHDRPDGVIEYVSK